MKLTKIFLSASILSLGCYGIHAAETEEFNPTQSIIESQVSQSPQANVVGLRKKLKRVYEYLKLRLGTSMRTGETNLVYLVKFNPNTTEEKEAHKITRDKIRDILKKMELGNPLGINNIPELTDLRDALILENPVWTASWAGGTPVHPAIPLPDLTNQEKASYPNAASTKKQAIKYIEDMIRYLETLPSTADQSLNVNDIPLIEKALRKEYKDFQIELRNLSEKLSTFFQVTKFKDRVYVNGMHLFFPYSKYTTLIEEYKALIDKCSVQRCKSEDLTALLRQTEYLKTAVSAYDPAVQGTSKLVYGEKSSQQISLVVNLIHKIEEFRGFLLQKTFTPQELKEKLKILQSKRQANIDKIKNLVGKEEIWVLSLDGGGIRGLLGSMVLDNLSKKIGRSIPDAFDFFAGTSVGGLISLGLNVPDTLDPSRPQYSAEYIAKLLKDNGGIIFPKTAPEFLPTAISAIAKSVQQAIGYLYNPMELEDLLRRNFENKMISESIKPTLVTAVDITNAIPTFFASYKTEAHTGIPAKDWSFRPIQNIPMWEAGRATSAATTYFPRKVAYHNGTIKELIDGGITTNNPTLLALQEIRDLCKSFTPYCKIKKINVVSIGTGKASIDRDFGVSQTGIENILHDFTVVGMNFGSLQADKGVKEALDLQLYDKRHPTEYTYYRFNPVLTEPIELDSASDNNISKLEITAKRIMNSKEFHTLIRHIHGQNPGQDRHEIERVPDFVRGEDGKIVVDDQGKPQFRIVEQPKRIFNMD